MALATIGTAANNTLNAIKFAYAGLLPADMAAIQTSILDDSVPAAQAPIFPGAFIPGQGQLFIPNRGVLQVLPGDYIAVSPATGWPILISARAAAGASWVHVP
jgi:hypothetical protein